MAPNAFAVPDETACLAARTDQQVKVAVSPKWAEPGKSFEGWGTALAWFANVTGRLRSAQRDRLADLLYGESGLRFNIARYNIGGGNAPEGKAYLRTGADISGFWKRPSGASGNDWWHPDDPSQWDWSADPGQRWWLGAIRERVPREDQIFEAFSNSPPYFMTVSGRVSGNLDGLVDNLRPGNEEIFADYLVRVTAELEQRHHIHFRTLSPINEPNTPYWYADNTQEGAHWSPAHQATILTAVAKALRSRGLTTTLSAMDETNAQTFVEDWAGLDQTAIDAIDQINVHSYDTTGKTAIRDIAQATGKRLWMSEVDLSPPNVPQAFDDMRPALALGEQIVSDINRLRPVGWVLWQAVENEAKPPSPGSDWGLIKMNYDDTAAPQINITTKYWAMANFSRFIRPGDRFIPVDDTDTVVALRPDNQTVVVVHVNPGLYSRHLMLSLPSLHAGLTYNVSTTVTDAAHHAQSLCAERALDSGGLVVPPKSVTTFVLRPVDGGRR
ncbi:glycoside hydrolase family 30 protein [Asticcacaulis sp. 201]|uniref:glycoside hydrolase family 30 protein n=1 Tax=Asticcacaulis sp. 201 TaxID=3028787 RepID=UPI002915CCCA|nr:glycoside hydrolase [Asticcacaulis sp. 201]MDV6332053.1 glycoside hydrolase [Asticcacaulis sp. 201]